MNKKALFVGILFFSLLFVSGCASDTSITHDQLATPAVVVETVVVEKEGERIVETVIVTAVPDEIVEAEADDCCGVYRIGILDEPLSFNYWHHLGDASSVWFYHVFGDDPAFLFELSDQRYQFVPSLAKGIPDVSDDGNGTWTITVEMVEDALWSDGKSISAEDVVFTHTVCKDLELGSLWPNYCAPNGVEVTAEAANEFAIQFTFHGQAPTIDSWQAGVALIPILPEHFWADAVNEAYSFVEGLDKPALDRPQNCASTVLSESDQETCLAWEVYDEGYSNARSSLYKADADDQPVAGGYVTTSWVSGEFIEQEPNQNYYFKDSEIIEYQDGTWVRIMPDGAEFQYYGDAEGDETLRYMKGPHNPLVRYNIYDSRDAANHALFAGEVDYVLAPFPLSRDYLGYVDKYNGVNSYVNQVYNMFYVAFNMQREPMSNYEFRQAFDIMIDKDFIANQVLGGTVTPLSSTMPSGNYNWHFDMTHPYRQLSRLERIELAVQVLNDAGWSWESEPYWDDYSQAVIPGEGLVMPSGQRPPELTLIAPGIEFDPIRTTYSFWITEWARELGISVQTDLVGRDAILDRVFVDGDFDMYIYGWSLGSPQFPGYFDRFWHSRYCTVETGGRNAPCFKSDQYDALVDEFLSTSDLARAKELAGEMQIVLADQRPYIPLFSTQIYELAQKNIIFPYVDSLGGIEAQSGFKTDAQVLLSE